MRPDVPAGVDLLNNRHPAGDRVALGLEAIDALDRLRQRDGVRQLPLEIGGQAGGFRAQRDERESEVAERHGRGEREEHHVRVARSRSPSASSAASTLEHLPEVGEREGEPARASFLTAR